MLVKWNLFSKKSKSEKESKPETEEDTQIQPEEDLKIEDETITEEKEPEVIEYREVLYSRGHAPKEDTTSNTVGSTWRRKSWESADTIEKNIDSLGRKKTGTKTVFRSKDTNIDKIVDKLFSKKKK